MCAEMINFWPFTDELRGSDSLKVATNEAFAVALTRDTFCVDPMLKKHVRFTQTKRDVTRKAQ